MAGAVRFVFEPVGIRQGSFLRRRTSATSASFASVLSESGRHSLHYGERVIMSSFFLCANKLIFFIVPPGRNRESGIGQNVLLSSRSFELDQHESFTRLIFGIKLFDLMLFNQLLVGP